jgi:predicted NACHT family NTPase
MPMTDRLREYLRQLVTEHRDDLYIPRVFRRAEDWDKWAGHDWRGHRFGNEPGLLALLEQRRVIVLGEPGCGKSTLASAAVRSAIDKAWVPVLLKLREYKGDLSTQIRNTLPDAVREDVLSDPSTPLLFVPDGFDEVPSELVSRLLEDLTRLERQRPDARLILTSRQAFFINQQ